MERILPTAEQLAAIYEELLRPSFPPAELKPLKNILEMWDRGLYHPWCFWEDGTLLGVCFLWSVEPGWALLDYLCVSPQRRNGGLGGRILETLRREEPGTVLLAESEEPCFAPDPETASRRLMFYSRSGARTAGVSAAIFTVPYRLLYWWETPISDASLAERYRNIYRESFSREKYENNIQIPRKIGHGEEMR